MNSTLKRGRIAAAATLATGLTLKIMFAGTVASLAVSTAQAQDIPENIEEIIVVVTRREASVQDVPVAVTAVTGSMLVDAGVVDVYTLQE